MPRGRLSPRPLHAYLESVADSIARVRESPFHHPRPTELAEYESRVDERGHEVLTLDARFCGLGGLTLTVHERCRFARASWRAHRGARRLLTLVEYSYNVSLGAESLRRNVFRYDSPDEIQTLATIPHHRFHHRHDFDVFGSGAGAIARVDETGIPTFWEVFQEAERWYWTHRERFLSPDED